MIHTDNDDKPCMVCPARKTKPTAALLQHSEKAALPSQTKAINEFRAAEAVKQTAQITKTVATHGPQNLPDAELPVPVGPAPMPRNHKRVRGDDDDFDNIESGDDERENARTNPKCESICYLCKMFHSHGGNS
jgi:hypothetical protein